MTIVNKAARTRLIGLAVAAVGLAWYFAWPALGIDIHLHGVDFIYIHAELLAFPLVLIGLFLIARNWKNGGGRHRNA